MVGVILGAAALVVLRHFFSGESWRGALAEAAIFAAVLGGFFAYLHRR